MEVSRALLDVFYREAQESRVVGRLNDINDLVGRKYSWKLSLVHFAFVVDVLGIYRVTFM